MAFQPLLLPTANSFWHQVQVAEDTTTGDKTGCNRTGWSTAAAHVNADSKVWEVSSLLPGTLGGVDPEANLKACSLG